MWLTISNWLTKRICALPVRRNDSIAERANSASRRVCANSLTVAMLVYASVMRPVICERASAWALPTAPSRGTNQQQAAI
ncbi:hypothetical protein D3C85_1628830 [compost metagenome]